MDGNGALRVLVVDDDPAIVRLIATILRTAGYTPLQAGGGADGLAVLDELPGADLVILDLEMPEVDGWTFYRSARLLGYSGPVIICSARGAENACEELGASAAIAKPFDPDDLLSCIEGVRISFGQGDR